jgi:hypothetical protein
MAFLTGQFVGFGWTHDAMTTGTVGMRLGGIVTSHAACVGIRLVHGPIQRHPFSFLCPILGVTGIACIHGFMMTYPAGGIISFMRLVIKWNEIHSCFRLFGVAADFHHHHIRLLACHPGDILNPFNHGLLNRIMTSLTVHRTGFFLGRYGFFVAVDTPDMGRLAVGYAVVLSDILMAIPAGTLFFLGIKQFFGFFVKFMVAQFTFVLLGLGMTEMKGFIELNGDAAGLKTGNFEVALATGDRSGFFFGCQRILMALDAFGMIHIGDFAFGPICCPLKFQGKAVFIRQMAHGAVFLFFFKRVGMKIMRKFDTRALQPAIGLQCIDGDQIRPDDIGLR